MGCEGNHGSFIKNMSWKCSTQSTLVSVAAAALASFESFIPALEQAGRLNPSVADEINAYVTAGTNTLNGVIADIKSGSQTLPKVAAVIQTLVSQTNTFSAEIPPGILVTVNLVNIALQTLLAAIQQQITLSAPPVSNVQAVEPAAMPNIVPDKGALSQMSERLMAVQKNVHAALVA